ncbi:xanthine dehydrogenase family protein subunit M [Paroceanicella profunda]|uniref:Xanthine dehydrogenase family protein subunit M n=1 Tax=Paroceanicella profunda TaxID=2579971 RepID=A0A5B8FW59_9RHOB|nr:xanthine dehydrogenase family protein subunit M [Paroceanicella profunda]QDL91674.1 xanthine dehydrogenase family protein subunit M [Paroceanicella profunda]
MLFHRPETLENVIGILEAGPVRLLAGGTDLYPGLRDGPPPAALIDLSRVPALRGITRQEGGWRIGATTTWTDILRADLPPLFDGLRAAAREVGSVQIQNAGTVAGNICNASPAADGVPPLLTLEAEVELAGPAGRRRLPLAQFITGVRRTALAPGELVTALHIPEAPGARSAFLKLGARRYLVISIAMVSAVVIPGEDGTLREVRLAVGACSAVARRLPGLEAALTGRQPGAPLDDILGAADLSALTPLDDVRGSAAYRLDAVREILGRVLAAALPGETHA